MQFLVSRHRRLPELARTLTTYPRSRPRPCRNEATGTETKRVSGSNRVREAFKSFGISLAITLVTLAALEVVLRIADFRELRETLTERSLAYDYDPELGWTLGKVQRAYRNRLLT